MDLTLNNQQWLIYHKTQTNQTIQLIDWVYLFNDISTPYGLFKAKISLICRCLVMIEEREKKRNEKRRKREEKNWERVKG